MIGMLSCLSSVHVHHIHTCVHVYMYIHCMLCLWGVYIWTCLSLYINFTWKSLNFAYCTAHVYCNLILHVILVKSYFLVSGHLHVHAHVLYICMVYCILYRLYVQYIVYYACVYCGCCHVYIVAVSLHQFSQSMYKYHDCMVHVLEHMFVNDDDMLQ